MNSHYFFTQLFRPPTVERAHRELLELATTLQNLPGKTGRLATEVARYLRFHLEKEDEHAPLLSLLKPLAFEKLTLSEAQQAAQVYERLREEYARMTGEHVELFKLTEQLKSAGAEEGHPDTVRFAETLERHVQDEEELLYPAALLAGRLASQAAASIPWKRL